MEVVTGDVPQMRDVKALPGWVEHNKLATGKESFPGPDQAARVQGVSPDHGEDEEAGEAPLCAARQPERVADESRPRVLDDLPAGPVLLTVTLHAPGTADGSNCGCHCMMRDCA